MWIGTTVLALGLMTGAPETKPDSPGPGPQKKVETPGKNDKDPHGKIMFLVGVQSSGARFRLRGDVEKGVPFQLSLPLGKFVSMQWIHYPNRE